MVVTGYPIWMSQLKAGTGGNTGGGSVPAHTHSESQIYDLDKYTQAEVDALLASMQADIDSKADAQATQDALDQKADTVFVESEVARLELDIAQKADTTYVNAELSFKADTTYVDDQLANKADIAHDHDHLYSQIGHNHDTEYSPLNHTHDDLAEKVYVDQQDQILSDAIDTKADAQATQDALDQKADIIYVDSEIAKIESTKKYFESGIILSPFSYYTVAHNMDLTHPDFFTARCSVDGRTIQLSIRSFDKDTVEIMSAVPLNNVCIALLGF